MIARIWIGGQLDRSRSETLVDAVRRSNVTVGEPFLYVRCQPISAEGLLEALGPDGVLHLQHPQGELDRITHACRSLGLTYRLWRSDPPEVELWASGMAQPARLYGHPDDPRLELIEVGAVRRAIKLLQRNKTCLAKHTLIEACPDLPAVPPLEPVER